MRKGLDIFGTATYFVFGRGYETTGFNYLNMSIYVHPMLHESLYCIDFAKPGAGFTQFLDPENDLNGLIVNGKKYFGKELNAFFIEFNNLVNEQALKVLD